MRLRPISNGMKKSAIILIVIIILIIWVMLFFYSSEQKALRAISNFEECKSQGYPVMKSLPLQCRTPDGRNFVEDMEKPQIGYLLIRVENPTSGSQIASPLEITGQARGNWYFEADFPITLEDQTGRVLAQTIAQAQGEWMTTEFVPFKATLNFNPGALTEATLIFHKNNPSGLPENDDRFEIPVKLKNSKTAQACLRTGCSSQICSDEEIVSTCEFLPQYACYQLARCEKQVNGECGWTETAEFKSCIANI